MRTEIGVNDPKAVTKWATGLAIDYRKDSYWSRFTGRDENSIVHERVDLDEDAGDTIQFDLVVSLKGDPVFGDDQIEGKEEALSFATDEVKIDQVRKPVSAGGRMSRKRTIHDLRSIARRQNNKWMTEWMDELHFVYASGALGTNGGNKIKAAHAGNPIEAPDSDHILYAGAATSKASLAATDKVNRDLVERLGTKAKMINAVNPDSSEIVAVNVNGEKHYIFLMSPFQVHDLRTASGTTDWLALQRDAGARGSSNPIFTGSKGMVNGIVLHEHRDVRLFTDYGAGGNVPAARGLFLGAQALTCAWGGAGRKARFSWVEKLHNADNDIAIYVGAIVGVKKTKFKGRDHGIIAVDSHAKDPNAA